MIGRRKKPSPLPARVYEKHGTWWFVDTNRKWHKLCRVSEGMAKLYAELARFTRDIEARRDNTMPALIDDWLLKKLKGYSANTQADYQRMALKIRDEFDEEWCVEDVRPADIARFLDKYFEAKPNTSNKYRALFSLIFAHAVRRGLRDVNPAAEVKGASEAKRDRYLSDAEFDAVRAAALLGRDGVATDSGPVIACLLDLAYQTGQRIGDLLALNWQDISDEGIYFRPSKTVNSSGVKLLIQMSPDLRATLDAAKAGKIKAIGPVICTQDGGRYTYSGAHTAWKRACKRARERYEEECAKARPPREPDPLFLRDMHFHDLRAKALTDAKRIQGAAAAQALGGHTTEGMTAHYTKAREVERVAPVPLRARKMEEEKEPKDAAAS
ncbi:tyrosine-type recombinase/integrase [Burkholderia gladioli]|uniref:tyrosine-type recombinase/integrase n=1 Tax=Burkholderia gladioli TaxID=28095 RepID=UPI001FC7DCC6|nr:tyrosine-type recombinase/integrase [Burkholderia gladioli]